MNRLIIYVGIGIASILLSCNREKESKDDLAIEIDHLFSEWDSDKSPGAAVAILKEGEIIFKKGYGMANLEYGIPIEPSTKFYIASESKQFTAFCIALLAQRGQLSLHDSIHKYLPELPNFGKKITIKDLIHHTSRLRNLNELYSNSGTRVPEDVLTRSHAYKLIKGQRRLNFDPGERYIYCNTGYWLLGEIVKQITNKSLREFAAEEIFQPLGMINTHFHDNYKELATNSAYSYQKDSATFEKAISNYSVVGPAGIYTTVEDAAKWLMNYETLVIGGQNVIDQMYELTVLNSGETLTYAFGLNIDRYKGWKRIGHGGHTAGFQSYMVRFPEENLGIIVFSNLRSFDQYTLAMSIADIFLEDKSELTNISTSDYKAKAGKYCNEEGWFCELTNSSELEINIFGEAQELTPLTDSTFSFFHGFGRLKFFENKNDVFEIIYWDEKQLLRKYKSLSLSDSEMINYEGTYLNNEVNGRYTISKEDKQLVLKHEKYDDTMLNPIIVDQFSTTNGCTGNINFKRDARGEIIGFEINSGRVLHLFFEKSI